MKLIVGLAGALLVLAGATEVAARVVFPFEGPLFDAPEGIGYIPRPNQPGFNEVSMRAGPFDGSAHDDTLLAGDSIVFSGKFRERLGTTYWPIGAGSWALLNELAYIARHPAQMSQIERAVFILNSRDFAPASVWTSEVSTPTHRPASIALRQAANFYITRIGWRFQDANAPAVEGDWSKPLHAFCQRFAGTVTVLLYPDKQEFRSGWAPIYNRRQGGISAACPKAQILDVARLPGWGEDAYRDHIHPTDGGASILSRAIRDHAATPTVTTSLAPKPMSLPLIPAPMQGEPLAKA